MINILTDALIAKSSHACVCACYSPNCQTDWDYMMGYADGLADGTLDYSPIR